MAAANFGKGEYVTDEVRDLWAKVIVRDLGAGLLRVQFHHYEATVNTNRQRPANDDEPQHVKAAEERRAAPSGMRAW